MPRPTGHRVRYAGPPSGHTPFTSFVDPSQLLHRLAILLGPAGFVAVIAGWITTEVGRQPYTIYGLLRTTGTVVLASAVLPTLAEAGTGGKRGEDAGKNIEELVSPFGSVDEVATASSMIW